MCVIFTRKIKYSPTGITQLAIHFTTITMTTAPLRVLIHAPTPDALARARNSAANLRKASPDALIRIIANAQAVGAALDAPHEQDALTWLCPNTLASTGHQARMPLQTLPHAAILELAQQQHAGWTYIRA